MTYPQQGGYGAPQPGPQGAQPGPQDRQADPAQSDPRSRPGGAPDRPGPFGGGFGPPGQAPFGGRGQRGGGRDAIARAVAAAPATVALLGVAGFFFGFGPYLGTDDGYAPNFFGSMFGNPMVVALVLIAGLISALGMLPKQKPNPGLAAVASATAVLVLLCSLGFSDINNFFGGISRNIDPGVGAGWAFWAVLGIAVVQTAFSAIAVLVDAGILHAGAARPSGAWGQGAPDYQYGGPAPYGYGRPPQGYAAAPGPDPRYAQQPMQPQYGPQFGQGGPPAQPYGPGYGQGYGPQPGYAGPPPGGAAPGPRYGYPQSGPQGYSQGGPEWGTGQAYGGRPDPAGPVQSGGAYVQGAPPPEGDEDPTHMFRAASAGGAPAGDAPDTDRTGGGVAGNDTRDDPTD
ncbi:DUF5336 domain-containing protein [Tomitella fengzijianii]|uniref:34 kDa antigenic protein n=1 Tax=Tomitella fengzijianii TaxID=2597660 RepID=A0A516X1R7_9ACTN|nr:DUF5336 domain-containing protein [Tomitella fengzijianii]QDQ97026.1 hypothetical protein FO059_06350 [Tomitella fengzijianii]